jgi:hypothetical protein
MNIAVASAHRAFSRSEIGARYVDERFAERRSSRLVANERREDVSLLQKQAARYTDGLLSFTKVNAPGNETTAIQTR